MTTTSAALELEAETVRADLSATLDDLRSNMTRAALAGGAAALAREGGATVARAAARRASDHPLATLLIGAGLVMLLSNGKAGTTAGRIIGRAASRPRGCDGVSVATQQAAGQAMDWAAVGTFLPEALLQAASFAASFAVISLLFALMFKWLPDVSVTWRAVWLGAIGTAALFEIGKYVIAFYIGKQGLESKYGAAASVVIVLIWVYYSAQIVLLGAEFTHVRHLQQTKGSANVLK
jgi:hypothetical protein